MMSRPARKPPKRTRFSTSCVEYKFSPVASGGATASGDGWVGTTYAGAVLSSEVGNLVAAQFAAAHGIHLDGSDLATAQNNYVSTLAGGLSSLVAQVRPRGAAAILTPHRRWRCPSTW